MSRTVDCTLTITADLLGATRRQLLAGIRQMSQAQWNALNPAATNLDVQLVQGDVYHVVVTVPNGYRLVGACWVNAYDDNRQSNPNQGAS